MLNLNTKFGFSTSTSYKYYVRCDANCVKSGGVGVSLGVTQGDWK